ncbi:MAG: ACT domain-containing protein [candidate division WOR-3 bacterium]
MRNIKVIKIGGSILEKPEDYLRMAENIINSYKKSKIILVTSAMKGKTDSLYETFKRAIPSPDFWNMERFLPLGEIESSILFESAFNFLNIRAKTILPWMREWPIYISIETKTSPEDKRNFDILNLSNIKVRKHFLPLFEKYRVLIIPGFVAKDGKGRILTLGRGGSDISGVLIAELLNLKEVIFLKDTGGILSGNPSILKRTKRIKKIFSEELGILSSSGAKVLNPLALKYTENIEKMKVVSPEFKKGTKVLFREKIKISMEDENFSVLTFVGNRLPETPGILYEISKKLYEENISIYSITISDNLISIYLLEEDSERGYLLLSTLLKKIKNLKMLNIKKGIKKILIRSLKFINEPGVIKKIVTPISKEGINIWEILTLHTDIMTFIEKKDAYKTFEILKRLFERSEK